MGSCTATGEPAFSAIAGYFLQSGTLNAPTSSNNTVLWSFAGDGLLIVPAGNQVVAYTLSTNP